MVRLIVLYLHQTEVCVHCMGWSSRERGGQGEGGLRCVHWLSERGRGICIGCRREGARWTEGGRVEVCALAVGEREGCALAMDGRSKGVGDGHGGIEGWVEGEGERMGEKGMEGVMYGDEAVKGRILNSTSLWNNSALHARG